MVSGRLGGHEVLVYRDGVGTISTSTPRPYLHPVRTLGGVVVTATHPSDHDWHTGVGMAIPDVNGTNFWGGGTYVHGRGYAIEDDHGVVRGGPVTDEGNSFRQNLEWIGASGDRELSEERRVEWAELTPLLWRLTFDSALTSDHSVTLGSPGSKGRVGGGYGGFFWRFPRCEDVAVFTPSAHGEDAVHGTVAPWVAWSADFGAGPGISGPATVIIASADAVAHSEPWFVRAERLPGDRIGAGLGPRGGACSRSRPCPAGSTSWSPTGDSMPSASGGRVGPRLISSRSGRATKLVAGTSGVLSRSTGAP